MLDMVSACAGVEGLGFKCDVWTFVEAHVLCFILVLIEIKLSHDSNTCPNAVSVLFVARGTLTSKCKEPQHGRTSICAILVKYVKILQQAVWLVVLRNDLLFFI